MTKSHSKLEDEPELGIMDIKNWSYFRAIERNKVLFEFVKCRKTFEISNDVIPIFVASGKKLLRYLSVPYLIS